MHRPYLPPRAWRSKNIKSVPCNLVAIANKKQIVFLTGQQCLVDFGSRTRGGGSLADFGSRSNHPVCKTFEV